MLARPSLLLLDEPTAHLDPANEAALRRSVDDIADECALLVIAHRFSTVKAADHIAVLDGGTIVATGTHDDLMDTCPYYRDLASSWTDQPVRAPR